MAESPNDRESGFWGGALAGLIAGAVMAALLMGGVSVWWMKKKERDVRRGWNLVPVLVLLNDTPAGTTLTWQHLAERSVPEQYVTASVFHPDQAYQLVGLPTLVDLKSGDMVRRSDVEATDAGSDEPLKGHAVQPYPFAVQ